MKFWPLLAILFFANSGHADNVVSLAFGPALDGANLQPHVLSVRLEHDFENSFTLVSNASGFFEPDFLGAFSVVPSVKVLTLSGTFLRAGVGLGLVTHTDARLSSIPEFNIEVAYGLTNGHVDAGLVFDHWSNGSVLGGGPNLGWDTLQFLVGVHL